MVEWMLSSRPTRRCRTIWRPGFAEDVAGMRLVFLQANTELRLFHASAAAESGFLVKWGS
jgi:hypothetical protein